MSGTRLFLIDNYDSFTYNLFQYLSELGADVMVRRNDRFTLDELRELDPDGIVISPGPGTPADSGLSPQVIEACGRETPILGVCLGHQTIGEVFGGRVVRAPAIFHGKVSEIHHQGRSVFAGLPSPFTATRYHSLVIAPDSVPACLEVTAQTADGVIMGVQHRDLPIVGVQFHPESALTREGKHLLQNFIDLVTENSSSRKQGEASDGHS